MRAPFFSMLLYQSFLTSDARVSGEFLWPHLADFHLHSRILWESRPMEGLA